MNSFLFRSSLAIVALGFTLTFAQTAGAVQITCTSLEAATTTSFDTDLNSLVAPLGAGQPVPLGLHMVPGAMPATLSVLDAAGASQATFEVRGNALNPTVNLLNAAGKVACALTGDPEVLFEKLITDAKTVNAMKRWKTWAAARPTPCDPFFDSLGYFQPGSNGKIALVLHGYSSNPRRMTPEIKLLLDNGYNVIAPRLAKHFDQQIKDLDLASSTEWIQDAEDTLAIAQHFGNQVTVLGYSLGGELASRLALSHPNAIDRMILIAPAWRVTQGVSWGSLIGGAFSISYNDFMKIPTACTASAGYTSSVAGRQVEEVAFDTDRKFDGGRIDPFPMEYARLRLPFMVFTTPNDNTVESVTIDPSCKNDYAYCTKVDVPGREHTNFTEDLTVLADGAFAGRSMQDLMTVFIQAKFSDDPRYLSVLDPDAIPLSKAPAAAPTPTPSPSPAPLSTPADAN